MIDILTITARSTCGNCRMPVVKLEGSLSEPHWTHPGRGVNGGTYETTCEGAPVATPTEIHEVHRADASEATREAARPRREVVHACPPGESATMPCCGRAPFEVPAYHRMTLEPGEVTCRG